MKKNIRIKLLVSTLALTGKESAIVSIFFFDCFRCPPCRRFTPLLIDFYNKHAAEKKFEIIFVSSDSDEESFEDYYKDMPWLKLDFQQPEIKDKLEAKFQVEGIPRLVLIDGHTGQFICHDAREYIQSKDKNGEKFPWKSDGKKEGETKDCILL